jgi:phosphoribosylamine---glycine ligase
LNVLVVGSGGREHTLVWKLAQSPRVDQIYAVPGNAGMAALAECHDIATGDGFDALADFAVAHGVDLTVVGPEAPLVAGIVDTFEARGLRVFGPNAAAARLEGSKEFAKEIMTAAGAPTSAYRAFTAASDAHAYIDRVGAPIVVKADGLAAGKGVVVCQTAEEAHGAIDEMMVAAAFGDAGSKVVIEECLVGEEASFTVFCDGVTAVPLAGSQDHKPIYDGDQGPNTGGMGAYSPAPVIDDAMHETIMADIVAPVLDAMAAAGCVYRGILYVGLMITEAGPKIIEFNCRLGDPETQVILPRLKSDLADLIDAAVDADLASVEMEWHDDPCACVVVASGGYPDSAQYTTGHAISGLGAADATDGAMVFHAGTASRDGHVVTAGGRVLGVTALGPDIATAIERAYAAMERIDFHKAYYRRDIGHRALARGDHGEPQ